MAKLITSIQHTFFASLLILVLGCFSPAWAKASTERQTSRTTINLLTSLANAGRAEAQYSLGKLYLAGNGVEQDYSIAFSWLEKAALQNYSAAQMHLGQMYLNGNGIATNCAQAIKWFSAVKSGSYVYNHAQSNLAWAFSTCPDDNIRNGQQAIKITQQLIKSQPSNPSLLDTLAAALAETGQFELASKTQQQAIELIDKDNKNATSQLQRFTERLEYYQQNKPWRVTTNSL